MNKLGIWVLLIALAFVAGTLVTGTLTWADEDVPPGGTEDPTKDTDGDGVPDIEDSDDDNDGLTDEYEEEVSETNPTQADSDGDGTPDGEELLGTGGIDPETGEPTGTTDPNDDDSDDDGFTDTFENKHGSDPNKDHSTPNNLPRLFESSDD